MLRVLLAALISAWLLADAATGSAAAQVLEGDWVERSQQRIDQARKTEVRVIVLDEHDRPATDVPVRFEQLRHDFPLGFTLRDTDWPAYDEDAPLWRTFNAVALDAQTSWAGYDEAGEAGRAALEQVIRRARQQGMHVRWGGGVAADPARNPEWLSGLGLDDQQTAIETYAQQLARRFGWQVGQLDLYTHALDHDLLERQFGEPMIRRLYEQAAADAPDLRLGLRVHDRLVGDRLQELVRTVTDWRQAFIPIDVVAIEQRVHGSLVHGPLERALTWLGELEVDVVFVGLEVGGVSEAAASLNMETLLRMFFADPAVTGIWFGGLTAETTGATHAELIDDEGELTRAGRVVDRLFAELWWSDEMRRTDELGNARARVYAGAYRVTAVLDDDRSVDMTVHLPKSDDERIVVLQPPR